MEGGSALDVLLASTTGSSTVTDLLNTDIKGMYSQLSSLIDKLKNVNTVITTAQATILSDCTTRVTDGLSSAVQQATDAATAAANAAVDSNPKIQQILRGVPQPTFSGEPTFTGEPAIGGGGCRCRCNLKTRSKKKSKRSKTRVRH
jgi:hypothetical protein